MIHCLHGAVGSPSDWEIFEHSLGEKTKPWHLWDFFKDPPPSLQSAGLTIANHAAQGDILLGYSMGGRLALHALLSAPATWRAAIMISAHPGLITGELERLSYDEQWATLAEDNWPSFIEKWNQQTILASPPPGLHQASRKDQSAVAASFRHWSLGKQKNLASSLSTITCPVLWITGARDEKFTHLGREISTLIPFVKHEIVQDSGHRVPWEQPDLFASLVRQFINALP